MLGAASTSQKMSSFFSSVNFLEEKKLDLDEGIFAYHTVYHSHSFRSMDCTSKLLQNLYDKKNHCARTKCEAIIKNTFLKFAQENLKNDLKQVRYVSILGEASNYRATAIH